MRITGDKREEKLEDILPKRKDSIEVAWLVCPRDLCKDKEKKIQLTLSYLGYDLEWDKQSAFNNKKWQQSFYDSPWKYMFNTMWIWDYLMK
jgi:hypothetical protein